MLLLQYLQYYYILTHYMKKKNKNFIKRKMIKK